MCDCFLPIYWTSSSLGVPAEVTQEEGRTGFLVHLPSAVHAFVFRKWLHTGGVFSYLPHHLDLALEDSVGHSTCMSVLARRRAIMGAIMGWLVG